MPLDENECSEEVSEILEMVKFFRQQKFFVGNSFRGHELFVGEYILHLTENSSLFTDKVFTDKVTNFAKNLHHRCFAGSYTLLCDRLNVVSRIGYLSAGSKGEALPMFSEIVVLIKFEKFTGRHLQVSFFFQ